MTNNLYLINKKEKLLISCGNVTKDWFLEDYKVYCEIKEKLYGLNIVFDNENNINVDHISITNFRKLLQSYDIAIGLQHIQTNWMSLDYCWKNLKIDINKNNDEYFTLDSTIDKYNFKGYVLIEQEV